MRKRLSGVILFGCFLLWGSTITVAQCGSSIKRVTQNCGGHCGSVVQFTCVGIGTVCQNGNGDLTTGCCGALEFGPGACGAAKATPSRELLPSKEFLALRDAIALRKTLFRPQDRVIIASCGPDKDAFNEWLRVKLQQQYR